VDTIGEPVSVPTGIVELPLYDGYGGADAEMEGSMLLKTLDEGEIPVLSGREEDTEVNPPDGELPEAVGAEAAEEL
jgi:hypothetical protein